MLPKNRDHYLATSTSRDFTWFFLWGPAMPRVAKKSRVEPKSSGVPKSGRAGTPATAQDSTRALMSPTDVKAQADAARPRPDPSKSKQPKSRKPASKRHGPWSDWYVSDNRHYLLRARKSPNETWDYQFARGYPQSHETQSTSPTTSSSELTQRLPPGTTPRSPEPSPSQAEDHATSPKSSWPTILTTSTGQPTEAISASSQQTLTTLPKEVEGTDDGDQGAAATSLALVPLTVAAESSPPTPQSPNQTTNTNTTSTLDTTPNASAKTKSKTKAAASKNNNNSNKTTTTRRPVGPVMRLLQEGRSRKAATANAAGKKSSRAQPGRGQGQVADARGESDDNNTNADQKTRKQKNKKKRTSLLLMRTGAYNNSSNSNSNSNSKNVKAKRLHAKVRSEKELRVEPKRRVRAWLKGVEMDGTPVAFDRLGLPVYR